MSVQLSPRRLRFAWAVTCLIATLYVLGWTATATGVIATLFGAPRAIRKIEKDRAAIMEQRDFDVSAERDRLGQTDEFTRFAADRNRQMNEEMAAAKIPHAAGVLFDGPSHTTMIWTLERVAKANALNIVIALLGGTTSTVASVWSLFL